MSTPITSSSIVWNLSSVSETGFLALVIPTQNLGGFSKSI